MGKLHISLLGTSFTVQSNEETEHLEKLLNYYERITEEVSTKLKNPLQISILSGIMICHELYKTIDQLEKISDNSNLSSIPGDLSIMDAQQQQEAEKRTLDMIQKIDSVLDTDQNFQNPDNPQNNNLE